MLLLTRTQSNRVGWSTTVRHANQRLNRHQNCTQQYDSANTKRNVGISLKFLHQIAMKELITHQVKLKQLKVQVYLETVTFQQLTATTVNMKTMTTFEVMSITTTSLNTDLLLLLFIHSLLLLLSKITH